MTIRARTLGSNGSSWPAQEQEGDQQWQERYDRQQGLPEAARKEDVYGLSHDILPELAEAAGEGAEAVGEAVGEVAEGAAAGGGEGLGGMPGGERENPIEPLISEGKELLSPPGSQDSLTAAGLPSSVSAMDVWNKKFGSGPNGFGW
jgi:hypothetical protein